MPLHVCYTCWHPFMFWALSAFPGFPGLCCLVWDEAARSVKIRATSEPAASVNLEYLMLALKAGAAYQHSDTKCTPEFSIENTCVFLLCHFGEKKSIEELLKDVDMSRHVVQLLFVQQAWDRSVIMHAVSRSSLWTPWTLQLGEIQLQRLFKTP